MASVNEGLLRELIDRQSIEELMSRYAHGVDRHDLDLIADVFHANAIDWHGPFRGGRDAFLAWVNPLHESKTRAHTHNITTHWSEVSGDTAYVDSYVLFGLFLKARDVVMLGSGRYVDRVERRAGRWRIAERTTLTEMRIEGDARSFHSAPGGYAAGRWDRGDVSYQRPLQIDGVFTSPAAGGRSRSPDPTAWQRLLDRRAIRDCIVQSVRGLDRNDREMLDQAYDPTGSIVSGQVEQRADVWLVERLGEHAVSDQAVAHHLTTHCAIITGDSAHAESYLIVFRRRTGTDTTWVGGIRALDRLQRCGDTWRIQSRRFVSDWEFEKTELLAEADDAYLHGKRDLQDQWYRLSAGGAA